MNAIDFIYDNIRLSDKGYIICDFSARDDTISNGAEISFAEVPVQYGVRQAVAGVSYDVVIQTTFSICKNFCDTSLSNDGFITVDEVRDIARWLNRKEYLPFVLLADGYEDITYFGTFHIDQILAGDKIIGLQLTMTTNSPFAWQSVQTYRYSGVQSFSIDDASDEVGYLYPTIYCTCRSGGILQINNNLTEEQTIVKNCSAGETIYFAHPIITTDLVEHDLPNDFNYIFPKITNTFGNVTNTFSLSMTCDIVLQYRPLAKIGV